MAEPKRKEKTPGPAKATGEREWRKITRPQDEWGKGIGLGLGDSFEGTFIKARQVTLPDQNSDDPNATREQTIYDFDDGEGNKVGVWGSYDLDERMAQVSEGDRVRITCVERVPLDGGRDVKRFDVLIAK